MVEVRRCPKCHQPAMLRVFERKVTASFSMDEAERTWRCQASFSASYAPREVDVSLLTREGVADPSSWWPELGERVKASRAS